MGEDYVYYNNGLTLNGNSFGGMFTTTSNWVDYGTTVTFSDPIEDRLKKLEDENKELRKRLSKLATLICTHIGQEQLKDFNEKNK